MQINRLENFTKGWLVGNFVPSLYKNEGFEVAIKDYRSGDTEKKHVHKIAREITAIVNGKFLMNNKELGQGDIVDLPPGEPADFKCLQSGATVVIKIPSVPDDKHLIG